MNSIEHARKLCQANGQKFTPIREAVLTILMNAAQPMSAYDILDKYRDGAQLGAQPPTIYRALSFLEENGLIHRMASTRQFVVCDHIGEHCSHNDMTQFFICDECGAVEEALISHALLHEIQEQAEKLHFKVQQPSLEIHGLCRSCQ
ncbi:Fur family transcriptional regulator [Thiomicrorhabdus indica]|uniref:Fur family transcriptional regulator n=1 Tax=Thiomicrorhabdus indica TaxID=2267253 RepID=UPI00102DFF09|nr:Fur family transcriptional regulator [Thiomicrorhabdus indica]